jgi:hypothetical protein
MHSLGLLGRSLGLLLGLLGRSLGLLLGLLRRSLTLLLGLLRCSLGLQPRKELSEHSGSPPVGRKFAVELQILLRSAGKLVRGCIRIGKTSMEPV